jgi:hypothetical protein
MKSENIFFVHIKNQTRAKKISKKAHSSRFVVRANPNEARLLQCYLALV